MRLLKNTKGFAIILAYLVSTVFLIIGIGLVNRLIYENRNTIRQKELIEAFYLAEAAVDQAIAKLPSDTADEAGVNFGNGQYSLEIQTLVSGQKWRVTSYGYIPDSFSARATRVVEAIIEQPGLPPNFFSNAVYTAGNFNTSGNSYNITGDVLYGGAESVEHDRISGSLTNDPNINPLARLNFEELRGFALAQGNVFTEETLDIDELPGSFWFDEVSGIPNFVYIEADLILRGDIGTIGGFILVVGNVINDPEDIAGTEINGNGTVDGCIYTTGLFRVNGGGGASLNVNGGVWSGSDGVRINGGVNIAYNANYMNAISTNMPPEPTEVQMTSWREIRAGE